MEDIALLALHCKKKRKSRVIHVTVMRGVMFAFNGGETDAASFVWPVSSNRRPQGQISDIKEISVWLLLIVL